MKVKRQMYAYDEDDKCFMKLDIFPTNNYSPIVFYKINGHMYLINDEHTTRSVASSNKPDKNNSINSTSITDETKNTEMKVSVLETFEKLRKPCLMRAFVSLILMLLLNRCC